VTYRAEAITQQDGSSQANSNCRMAALATGLDYDTLGKKHSTGAKMRSYSGDPEGGTSSDDAERAFKHYSETLRVHDGEPWSAVENALEAGRLVHIDVWSATAGGPCCKSACGHTMAIAPERNSEGKWLVSDPWCKPPKWVWWSASKLQAAAEEWADRCGYRSAQSGGPRNIRDIGRPALARLVREMFSRWTPVSPLHPDDDDYPGFETEGSRPCAWTCTDAHMEDSDVAINTNGSNLTSTRRLRLTEEAGFYRDAERTTKYGTLNPDTERIFIGPAVGTDSMALLVNTSKPYDDGQDRPTIVYVMRDKCGDPYQID
jgi:hypothetical protein